MSHSGSYLTGSRHAERVRNRCRAPLGAWYPEIKTDHGIWMPNLGRAAWRPNRQP